MLRFTLPVLCALIVLPAAMAAQEYEYIIGNFTICEVTLEVEGGGEVIKMGEGSERKLSFSSRQVTFLIDHCSGKYRHTVTPGATVLASKLRDDDSLVSSVRYGIVFFDDVPWSSSRRTYEFTVRNDRAGSKTFWVNGLEQELADVYSENGSYDFTATSHIAPLFSDLDLDFSTYLRDGDDVVWAIDPTKDRNRAFWYRGRSRR